MLKKLLLTTALISSTFGADATLIAGVENCESMQAKQIVGIDSEYSGESISVTLSKIRSTLTTPNVNPEEIKKVLLELGELSYINIGQLRQWRATTKTRRKSLGIGKGSRLLLTELLMESLKELTPEDEIIAAAELAGAEDFASGFEPPLPPPQACNSTAKPIIAPRIIADIKNPD